MPTAPASPRAPRRTFRRGPDAFGALGLRTRLLTTLREYALAHHFIKTCGGSDIHAGSKEARARVHLHDLGLDPEHVVYVGDTAHDAEAAHAMGVDCVLVAHGHQHRDRLQGLGVRVVDSFHDLLTELA